MHIRAGSYSFKLPNDSIGTLSFKKEQRLQYIKDEHGYPMQFKPQSTKVGAKCSDMNYKGLSHKLVGV